MIYLEAEIIYLQKLMFPKVTPPMPKGNWKASLAFSPTSSIKLPPKESKQRGDPKKSVETTKPKKKHKNGNTKRKKDIFAINQEKGKIEKAID